MTHTQNPHHSFWIPVLGMLLLMLAGACQPAAPEDSASPAPGTGLQTPAESPTGGAPGVVLVWERVGGIAGFCDRLEVYSDGTATVLECEQEGGEGHPRLALPAEQQEKLQDWLEALKETEHAEGKLDIPDGMRTSLFLAGKGDKEASPEDLQVLYAFAAEVFAGLSMPGAGETQ